jgi:hypothetical protein
MCIAEVPSACGVGKVWEGERSIGLGRGAEVRREG